MKTINFELSKRLSDLWLLDNIETEYLYQLLPNTKNDWWKKEKLVNNWNWKWRIYKTLTLEEAIEFLSKYNYEFSIIFKKNKISKKYEYHIKDMEWNIWINENLFLAIEEWIEYLLDNNLLNNQK